MISVLQYFIFLLIQILCVIKLYQSQQFEIARLFLICNGLLLIFSFLLQNIKKSKSHNFQELWARVLTFWWMLSVLGISFILPANTLIIVFALTSILSMAEYLNLLQEQKRLIDLIKSPMLIFISSLIVISFYLLTKISLINYFILQFIVLGILIPIYAIFRMQDSKNLYAMNTGYLFFVVMLSMGYLLAENNIEIFLITVFLTEIRDLISYWIGKLFSQMNFRTPIFQQIVHAKIAEQISPKKTWFTGFVSMIIITVLTQCLLQFIFLKIQWSQLQIFSFTFIISIFGLFGDLTFSLVKRIHQKKDSGTWLPGDSGVIDRIDSLIFTLPFIYFIFVAL